MGEGRARKTHFPPLFDLDTLFERTNMFDAAWLQLDPEQKCERGERERQDSNSLPFTALSRSTSIPVLRRPKRSGTQQPFPEFLNPSKPELR